MPTSNDTFTCVARCSDCKKELYRRERVQFSERESLLIAMPDLAICPEASHNTFPKLPQNFGADVEWYREKRSRRGKIYKLILEAQPPLLARLREFDGQ